MTVLCEISRIDRCLFRLSSWLSTRSSTATRANAVSAASLRDNCTRLLASLQQTVDASKFPTLIGQFTQHSPCTPSYPHLATSDLCFVSQGRMRAAVRRGGQFCCGSVTNLLQYLCPKNYRNIVWFDKVIAKIKGCNFLPHSVFYARMIFKKSWRKSDLFTLGGRPIAPTSFPWLRACYLSSFSWIKSSQSRLRY